MPAPCCTVVYFANVRPDYKWGYFCNTLVYAFTRPGMAGSPWGAAAPGGVWPGPPGTLLLPLTTTVHARAPGGLSGGVSGLLATAPVLVLQGVSDVSGGALCRGPRRPHRALCHVLGHTVSGKGLTPPAALHVLGALLMRGPLPRCWPYRNNDKYPKYVRKLVAIKAFGDFCVLATKVSGGQGQGWCNLPALIPLPIYPVL
jgi:hypothetical protein